MLEVSISFVIIVPFILIALHPESVSDFLNSSGKDPEEQDKGADEDMDEEADGEMDYDVERPGEVRKKLTWLSDTVRVRSHKWSRGRGRGMDEEHADSPSNMGIGAVGNGR